MSKSSILALAMAAATFAAIAYNSLAIAGNCTHSYDTASDGSSCGGRSADSKPGGAPN